MRTLNRWLAGILIFCVLLAAYFFIGGTLKADCAMLSTDAQSQYDAFSSAKWVIESDAAPKIFSRNPIGDASEYRLINVDIAMKNFGMFPAEWLEIAVQPDSRDVAVYALTAPKDIPAFSDGVCNLKLLTSAEKGASRSVTISYYVLGMKRNIEISVAE